MFKKFLIISLAIVFVFGIGSKDSLAVLNNPADAKAAEVGERSVQLVWTWRPDGGTINRFEITYWKTDESEKKVTPDKQPSGDVREWTIRTLEDGSQYQWTIMAVAAEAGNNSDKISGESFKTKESKKEVVCGNGECGAGEDINNCPEDCKASPSDGNGTGNGTPVDLQKPIAADTLEELFNFVINFLFYLVMALAPIMIIYAAFLIMTAAGKAEQVNKGKTIILWVSVAVAIILLAKGLPSIIKGALGG